MTEGAHKTGMEEEKKGSTPCQLAAILEADCLFRIWYSDYQSCPGSSLWTEILAPQCILYFLSKLLRVRGMVLRRDYHDLAEDHSNNSFIRAILGGSGAVNIPSGSDRSLRDTAKGFLLARMPELMVWQRSVRLFPSAGRNHQVRKGGIVFHAVNPGHVSVAQELRNLLRRDGGGALVITQQMASESEMPEMCFRDGAWRHDRKNLTNSLRTWLNNLAKRSVGEIFGTMTNIYLEDAERALRSALANFYLPQAADAVAVARRILEVTAPRVVLIQDIADFRTRAVAYEARRRGIAVFHHQFGCVGESSIEWGWGGADKHLVWGEWARQTAVALGIPERKIEIAGTPRFARVACGSRNTNHFRRFLFPLLPASRLSFGNGGSLTVAECRSTAQLLRQWIAGEEGCVLRVKRRPLHDESGFDDLVQGGLPSVQILPGDYPMNRALDEADAVITTHSTAGIEAIFAGKPLLVIDWGLRPHPFAYLAANGAAIMVDSAEALSGVVRTMNADRDFVAGIRAAQQRLAPKLVRLSGSDSTQAIASVLMQAAKTTN